MNPKRLFLGIVIFITALVIIIPRFYHLSTLPPGLHIDEVSFAADAKSIAETGRDTWNHPWPLVFKAYGEWKAPGLVYTMAFWNKVLGRMDNFVTRLPSALAGITILITFGYTLRLLFPESSIYLTLLSIFVLAFSPWHFDMSHIFYESFSATAFIALSLCFITEATLSDKQKMNFWIWAAVCAGISGYYYASLRYIAILIVIASVLIQSWSFKTKLRSGLIILLVLFVVGIGWVGDLVSTKGLNRLHYYQIKESQGSTLEIDEKRQYCFLSFAKDNNKSRYCYLIWNKPIYKIINGVKTYYTYLGSEFLFLRANSEFGFDSEYGAYLLPLLPLYVVGLVVALRGMISYLGSLLVKKENSTAESRVYTIYIAIGLIALAPAAFAANVNLRMGLVTLYIVGLLIGVGIKKSIDWISSHFKNFQWLIYLVFCMILGYFVVQSLTHYYIVFVHSNDQMWTSDATTIFSYVKNHSKEYDHIIDSSLHGPLAPYFYGDLTTSEVQNGVHSQPDDFGFTYLTQAGKYELRHVDLHDLACEKLSRGDKRRTLVITEPVPDLSSISKFSSRSWSGVHLMNEVYDVDEVITHEIQANKNFYTRCGPK